jgi:hypothetical protein
MGTIRWHRAGEQVGVQAGHRAGELQQPVSPPIWLEPGRCQESQPESSPARFRSLSSALAGWMLTILSILTGRSWQTWLEPLALPRASWTLLHPSSSPSQDRANPRFIQAAIQSVASRFQFVVKPFVFQGGLTAYES